MFKLKKKRPVRVTVTTRVLRELSAEERALLNKPTADPTLAQKGDVIETAFGLFLVLD